MFKEFSFNKDLEELARKVVVIDTFPNHNPADKYTKEEIELIDVEIEKRHQEWFAKLREARGKLGEKYYGCNHAICVSECPLRCITQEELEYSLKGILSESPEERYQDKKEMVWFHTSNWSMRGLKADDGYGCSPFRGCIPECRYYLEKGRVEHEEIIAKLKEYYKDKILSYHVDNKGQIIYRYPSSPVTETHG
jgi:hypothetical protein